MSTHRRAMLTPGSDAMRKLDKLAEEMRRNTARPDAATQRAQARLTHPTVVYQASNTYQVPAISQAERLLLAEKEKVRTLEGQLQAAADWVRTLAMQLKEAKAQNARLSETCIEAGKWAMQKQYEIDALRAELAAARVQIIDAPDYDCLPEGDDLELIGESLLAQFKA